MHESRLHTIKKVKDLLRDEFSDGIAYAVISSIFRNTTLINDINKIYNANKVEIVKHFMSSPIHESKILDTLVFEEAEIATKVTGIYYWSIANNNQALLTLALKNHKNLYQSYKMTNSFTKEVIISISKKATTDVITDKSDTDSNFRNVEAFLTSAKLHQIYGIPTYLFEDYPLYNQSLIVSAFYGVIHYFYDTKDNSIHTIAKHIEEITDRFSEEVVEFKKAWSIKDTNRYTYGYFMKILDISVPSYRTYLKPPLEPVPDIPEMLSNHFSEEFSNKDFGYLDYAELGSACMGLVRLTTDLNGYPLHDIDGIYISKKVLDYSICMLLMESEFYKIPWVATTSKLLVHIRHSILYNDYLKSRELTINTRQVESAKEISTALQGKEKENKELSRDLEKSNRKVNKLEEKLKTFEDKTVNLERDNKQLRNELGNVEPNQKELVALRSMMYEMQLDYEEDSLTDESREDKLNFINSHKLIILGGNEKWVNKMKEYFTKTTFMSPDSQNRDIKQFKTGKYVLVVNTATNSHSTTAKILPHVERNDDAKLIMMPNNFGINRTIEYIYKALTD